MDDQQLLEILKIRLEKNASRHEGLDWGKVQNRLEANSDKMRSLQEMESTGGEPDVVGYDEQSDEFVFFDCSPESPSRQKRK